MPSSTRSVPDTDSTPVTSTAAAEEDSGPPRWLVLLLAVSCGLTVANLYYAQPLLSALQQYFRVSSVAAAGLITVTQVGYAAGLIFLVPLGDRLENRRLVAALLGAASVALAVAGLAPAFPMLLISLLVGAGTLVVVQILVPFAADLAPDRTRGRVVGRVMTGLLSGILLSRTLGSILAAATDWRVVYLVSAALMITLALVLRSALPRREPTAQHSYGRLLRSTAHLVRIHPALRRRALYQAAMFGAFSAFWTTISFVLTSAPYHYGQLGVGLFALVGAGGALIAPLAGRWADSGLTRPMTAAAFLAAILAFALSAFGRREIVVLGLAAVVLDMAVQASLILGQQVIFRLDPLARARINSAFMAVFFLGGAAGSQIGSVAYRAGGWTAVAAFGGVLGALALVFWTTERRSAPRPSAVGAEAAVAVQELPVDPAALG